MTFITVLIASALGQLIALWIVGAFAHRKQMQQADAIRKAFEETMKEVEERDQKMREYARMES